MIELEDRITKKFYVAESGCWVWTASRSTAGYGRLAVDRHPRQAHRVVYEALVGPIPEGLEIDHLCRNRACVNPDHLEPVTRRENLLRGDTFAARHAAVTHCPAGHPYSPENTYVSKRAQRNCKTCANDYQRRRRAHAGK